jgi:hypothetical protein
VDPVSSEREGDTRIEDALSSETLAHALAFGRGSY